MAFATKKVGAVLHFSGHRADATGRRPARLDGPLMEKASVWIAGELASLKPVAAFGALASGADILFAEAVLRAGTALHVVLPLPPEDFQRLSVDGAVDDWRPRFAACWQAATSRRVLCPKAFGQDDLAIAFASQVAMGLALLDASRLSVKATQLLIWDGKVGQGPAGTGADAAAWQLSGAEQRAFDLNPPRLAPPKDLPLVYRIAGESERISARLKDALYLAGEECERRAVFLDVALRADDLGAVPAHPLPVGVYASENAAALAHLHLASHLALLPAKGQLYRLEMT